ncbi:MAG: sulfurtransferase complex subunit TusB [Methylococcaceae bacterium]|nr:MAG: sulfurtransferase complex subunit TusB [Methylococcaceae bacterium]
MAVLHIVKHSPDASQALRRCLARVGPSDSVLLIEDAVYAPASDAALRCAGKIYALLPDMAARGLTRNPLQGDVEYVDYAGFVQLVVNHDKVISWN